MCCAHVCSVVQKTIYLSFSYMYFLLQNVTHGLLEKGRCLLIHHHMYLAMHNKLKETMDDAVAEPKINGIFWLYTFTYLWLEKPFFLFSRKIRILLESMKQL